MPVDHVVCQVIVHVGHQLVVLGQSLHQRIEALPSYLPACQVGLLPLHAIAAKGWHF